MSRGKLLVGNVLVATRGSVLICTPERIQTVLKELMWSVSTHCVASNLSACICRDKKP
jgi:hypothetical protein